MGRLFLSLEYLITKCCEKNLLYLKEKGSRSFTKLQDHGKRKTREESNANVQSKERILKRQTRSIQTEGHFGDIKENENFRRFNYRSAEKVYKEFMLYAIGRNIMKYHRFLHHEIVLPYENLHSRYQRIATRRGGKRALIAVAPFA